MRVQLDVVRSLFHLLPGGSPEQLAQRQCELKRVITGVVASHPDVHYYQGLHDVAGVLLLVLGEDAAYVHLERLVQHHLRDCTRSNLSPVMNLLKLLPVLLARADPQLGAFIEVRARRNRSGSFGAGAWLAASQNGPSTMSADALLRSKSCES